MGTSGNVPLTSAYRASALAALSCIQWKAHHKFPVSLNKYKNKQTNVLDCTVLCDLQCCSIRSNSVNDIYLHNFCC